MSWKRRWGIVAILLLAQAGIVICYQGVLTGHAAPAVAQEQKPVPAVDRPAEEKELKEPILVKPEATEKGDPKPAVPAPLPQSVDFGAKPIEPVPAVPAPPRIDDQVTRTGGQAPPDTLPPIPLPPMDKEDKASPKPMETAAPPMAPADGPPAPKFFKMPPPGSAGVPTPLEEKSIKQVGGVTPPDGDQKPAPPAPPEPLNKPTSTPPSLLPGSPTAPPGSGADSSAKPMPPAVNYTEPTKPADPPAPMPAQTTEPPAQDAPCPWVLRVEVVKGRTLMTAQTGKEVQFRVSCDKLELQAPRGSILASGNVSVSSDGLDGSCDQLMIAWQADQVVLEGKAELKCRREGQEVDLKASRLSLRLSVSAHPDEPRKASLLRGKAVSESRDWISRGKQGAVQGVQPAGFTPASSNPGSAEPGANPTYDRYYGDDNRTRRW